MDDAADHTTSARKLTPVALVALGVVFGDIGTSPLYAVRECFHGPHAIALTAANVMGVLSLIFWSLVLVISVKYLLVVMRADNKGEGGILALMALVGGSPGASPKRGRVASTVIITGIFGAALLYGDGMITPAISVLSAIEGLEVVTPVLQPWVIPITLTILVGLFALQARGTAQIGKIFGPVTLLWFLTLAALGVSWIVQAPEVLGALSPHHAAFFFAHDPLEAFLVLGTVFLVVTGGEALYADMGHFGARPIRAAWFVVVLPSLVLNYFGQGALLLLQPEQASQAFYRMAPEWALVPLVGLATLATIIASQAVITGSFSLTWQAVQLGYLPRLEVRHTSDEEVGQIYIPLVNWALLAATIGLVLGFRTSSELAAAYGVAVTTTMVITTLLLALAMRKLWKWRLDVVIGITAVFLVADLAFFGANIIKVPDGGWFPLLIGLGGLITMTTWRKGRRIVRERLIERGVTAEGFQQRIAGEPVKRVPGTAVYLANSTTRVPPAAMRLLRHTGTLHERVLLVTVITADVPRLPREERIQVERLEAWLFRITLRCGYMQRPNVPRLLVLCREHEGLQDLDPKQVSYVLGRETLIVTERPGMAMWRERMFKFMARNAGRATQYFELPPERVLEIGAQIEL